MTENKHDTGKLFQTAPVLKTILNALPVGVVIFDHDARILYANEYAEQLFGKRESSALACSFPLVDRGSARHCRAVANRSGRFYRWNYCRASAEAWREKEMILDHFNQSFNLI